MPTKKTTHKRQLPVPVAAIERRIYLVRGEKIMLDADLAELYGVETKVLNQAVRRNRDRFPEDFMFQLTKEEGESLRSQFVTLEMRSQIVTSKLKRQFDTSETAGRGRYRKYLPYAFTEQGVAMLSSVLRSRRAVEVNIAIMRAFVNLRRMMLSNEELNRRVNALEQKYDENFKIVFDALRRLLLAPEKPRRRIGFTARE
jgi:hypothetical protein